MNMREKFKKLFTLAKKSHDGFTLVELIVVMAILGILAGVGVPAYKGYITEANKQADITLVSDVSKALQLHFYDSTDNPTSDYIILSSDKAEAGTEFAQTAMKSAFGEDWSEACTLAYDNWTDDGLLDYVLDNAESAQMIANSTFLTTSTTGGLMNAVTNLTDSAATFLKNYNGNVGEKLEMLLGEDFADKLEQTGVTKDDEEYQTVIANMMVGYFADTLNKSTSEDVLQDTSFVGMAIQYATLYAYCETIGDTETMEDIDNWLASANGSDLTTEALAGYLNNNHSDFANGYANYFAEGAGMNDIDAVLEIMGAVNLISGTYTDKDSLSNPDLYSSKSVAEQLNNYISAVRAVAGMDNAAIETLKNLPENTITVFIALDGSISVIPGAAYLAG